MRSDALRRWGPWRLLAAWIAYWVVLAIVVGPPIVRLWRLTHDPGRHGSASAGLRNDVVWATIAENGATVWAASVHMITLTLWFVGPPLLLYIAWLRSRPAPSLPRDPALVPDDGTVIPAASRSELGAGEALHATDRSVTHVPNPR